MQHTHTYAIFAYEDELRIGLEQKDECRAHITCKRRVFWLKPLER